MDRAEFFVGNGVERHRPELREAGADAVFAPVPEYPGDLQRSRCLHGDAAASESLRDLILPDEWRRRSGE